MTAFYNEIDPYAAQWLRNLIIAGHIAPGVVDERSIVDLDPDELRQYTQCHFFAGIGVWSHALRLAGWPDDRHVWTGSCPCQPFSAAGKGEGHEDERHLWPAWRRLIRECKPPVVFGEQVGSADGRAWLDVVCTDMEDDHYAIGAADLSAAGVGAPHIRQRLFFVAHAARERRAGERLLLRPEEGRRDAGDLLEVAGRGEAGLMAHAGRERGQPDGLDLGSAARGDEAEARERQRVRADAGAGGVAGFWSDADWIACRDGKARPVEPGTFPLAHGATARVGRLRAYGNAIVAPVAAEFIRAANDMKSLQDLDDLVAHVREFPYPALIKPLESLRAQFVLDIAPYRHLVLTLEQSMEDE